MIGTPRFQHGSLIRRYGEQFPHCHDAEKAALGLRAKINSEVRSPETVDALIAHYLKYELTVERKSFSTVEVNTSFLNLYVAPTWGSKKLSEVRTVAVEKWLSSVPMSPASRTKIKAVFSALFSHAIRHEWVQQNPIRAVRCSAKRLREKDVLTPYRVRCVDCTVGCARKGNCGVGRKYRSTPV